MADAVRVDCGTGEVVTEPLTPQEQDALAQAAAEADAHRQADQWATVDSVRGAQLRQTDYGVEPFPADMPNDIQQAFHDNEAAWASFRQGLRDITHSGDPTALVWPTLPPAPPVVLTPPPDFVDASSWGDNWTPAP